MSDAQGSRVGSMFGPYHLKRLLGRGGMGEVYEAEHTVKEWTVAVKLMSDTFSNDPVFRERMKREARTAGRLQEPHVVPIHDYGEIDGQLYLEMRLIEGIDLGSLLVRDGALPAARAVAIIHQVASALDAAHAAGVTHRDIKPPNVLVTRDDFAYLVDFGIASAKTDEKLTQLGTAVGTWKYMAPERFSNDEVTYLADIYALACVLHECLTGTPPYKSESATTLVTAHLMEPIPQPSTARPGIPRAFDAVVARGMAKKPGDRYASAGDLAMAAHDALSEPEQDHAVNILRRSQEATLPGTDLAPPPPPPGFTTPPPAPATSPPASTPVPPPASYPGWAPQSGPMPASQPTPAPQYYQGNWGGTPPPGTPPPQQFVGQPAWNQAPAPKKRNPWPIIAGVAALVVVLIAAAIGIFVATSGDDNKHTTARTTTSTTPPSSSTPTTTTTSSSELQNKLRATLPTGYASGVCKAATPKPTSIWVNALVMLDCGQNTNQGGPARAVYGLFADVDTLNKAFTDDIGANGSQLINCPGEGPSPDSWHYDKTPNDNAGQIACATYKNQANVIWSNLSKLTLSDTFSDGSIDDLHTWWSKFSG